MVGRSVMRQTMGIYLYGSALCQVNNNTGSEPGTRAASPRLPHMLSTIICIAVKHKLHSNVLLASAPPAITAMSARVAPPPIVANAHSSGIHVGQHLEVLP
jgi:hypothetical protein